MIAHMLYFKNRKLRCFQPIQVRTQLSFDFIAFWLLAILTIRKSHNQQKPEILSISHDLDITLIHIKAARVFCSLVDNFQRSFNDMYDYFQI